MQMSYRIGVDIGTTSLKAVLYDDQVRVVDTASASYKTCYPEPGRAEQDPKDIFQAFQQAILEIVSKKPRVKISELMFSSAMHSIIAVSKDGSPLTNCILWSDNRAVNHIENFKKEENWREFYQKTGTPIHSMSPFAKLLWMKQETNLLADTYKFIGIKEYLFWRICETYVVDYSIASATGLFDLENLTWDKEILQFLSLHKNQLSKPVSVTADFSFKDKETAESFGLTEETKLIVGASDGCLANLGSGAVKQGDTALTIGTSGAIRMTVDKPLLDRDGRTFCYYLSEGKWVIGGAVNNGGNVIQWLNSLLFMEENRLFSELPQIIRETKAGSNGLLFFPYLNGERAPFWDGKMLGSYQGLGIYHKKADIVRATIEGVLFNLAEVLFLIESIAGESPRILASGGFLQSKDWTQLAVDIFGKTFIIPEDAESSCLGAVLLVAGSERKINQSNKVEPNAENKAAYQRLMKKYYWYSQKLYSLHIEQQKMEANFSANS